MLRAVTVWVAMVLLAPPALAEGAQGLDLLRLLPGGSAGDFLNIRRARVPAALSWNANLVFSYVRSPLRVRERGTERIMAVVDGQHTLQLAGALAATDWLEVGLESGMVVAQSFGPRVATDPGLARVDEGPVPTDLALSAKIGLLRRLDWALTLVTGLALPTGGDFAGRDAIVATHVLACELDAAANLSVVANVGVRLGGGARFVGAHFGDEAILRLGAEWSMPGGGPRQALLMEIGGQVGLQETDPEEVALEVLLGWRVRFDRRVALTLGAGTGLAGRGAGVGDYRLVAALSLSGVAGGT